MNLDASWYSPLHEPVHGVVPQGSPSLTVQSKAGNHTLEAEPSWTRERWRLYQC